MIPTSNQAAPNPNRFSCSICDDPSADICVYCTKDACPNHRCERCNCCSDCCRCEVPLKASAGEDSVEDMAEELAPEAPAEAAAVDPPMEEPPAGPF